jgi:clusterin-associated protein 1
LDLLDKEKILKESREKAIEFLDNLSKNSDAKKEQEQIEKKIITILKNQESTLEQLDDHIIQLKQRSNELEEEIKMKQVELERADKRLESLQNAKPAHFNEQRQLEAELSYVYRIYVEKIRNHDFLENQLEKYLKIEEENKKIADLGMKGIKDKIKILQHKALHDDNDELNADEGNDDIETYQQEAQNKNVVIVIFINLILTIYTEL